MTTNPARSRPSKTRNGVVQEEMELPNDTYLLENVLPPDLSET
eukprot:CAMPEP_0172449854 /NCGR_PEP_ID=MMETSP1065-20121228/8449_1 /TAXON_ID=265537 /ORGANISM="Amphiprora paludosa, Strain CCMP125" /LENGTH=42 /DNA_ID= /DNA_START= /DNA_END= /DNA_ORIENTATION=